MLESYLYNHSASSLTSPPYNSSLIDPKLHTVALTEEDRQLLIEMLRLFKHVKSKKGKIEMIRDIIHSQTKGDE